MLINFMSSFEAPEGHFNTAKVYIYLFVYLFVCLFVYCL